MRHVEEITVQNLIVHLVNTHSTTGFILSDQEIPLQGKEKLERYFSNHILKSLHNPTTKAASFKVVDKELVSGICRDMLNQELDFVSGSRRLAEELHKIMSKDKRISPGSLAICFYKAKKNPVIETYLAILKIDLSEVFRPYVKEISNGERYVDFETTNNTMPTTREQLQKCAFIQSLSSNNEYDMMILDHQSQNHAQFFSDKFLGAKLSYDDQQRTDILYKSLVGAHNEIRAALSPKENADLDLRITQAIKSDSIRIDYFIEALPIDGKYKDQLDKIISEKLPDKEFNLDKEWSKKLLKKKVFKGDHHLKIEVRESEFKQVISSVEQVRNDNDKPPYYKIVIHTERWEEVPR